MSIEPAVPLINPFECWDAVYFWFHQNFPAMLSIFSLMLTKISLRCDRFFHLWSTLAGSCQAFGFNSLCFKSTVWWNLLALIVQQFYWLAFVMEVCWFFFSCVVAAVDLLHAVPCHYGVQCCDFIFTTKLKLDLAWVSCFWFPFCHLHFGVKIHSIYMYSATTPTKATQQNVSQIKE